MIFINKKSGPSDSLRKPRQSQCQTKRTSAIIPINSLRWYCTTSFAHRVSNKSVMDCALSASSVQGAPVPLKSTVFLKSRLFVHLALVAATHSCSYRQYIANTHNPFTYTTQYIATPHLLPPPCSRISVATHPVHFRCTRSP
jgi:hypothetical protein